MSRYLPLLILMGLPFTATAAPSDCTLPPLVQKEGAPKTAAAAQALRATSPCKIVPGIRVKALASVWEKLLANTRTGGRRLDTQPPESLPNGVALARAGKVHFDFSALGAEAPRMLQISVDGRMLVDTKAPPRELDIPVGRASAEAVFSWVLVTSAATYHGEFTLLPDAERREVEQQLAQLDSQHLEDSTRLVYQAAIYDEAGLYADRERILGQLRTLLGQ